MDLWIYIYQIKVNGSRFPVQVSVFQSGCVSVKYGPPLCWGTLRILSKMLNRSMCDVCLLGLTSSGRVYAEGSVHEAKNKETGKKMKLLGEVWGGRLHYHSGKRSAGVYILRKYMYVLVYWEERYMIQEIKRAYVGCNQDGRYATRGGGELVGVNCGYTNVGRRLKNNTVYPVLKKNCCQGSGYASIKRGNSWLCSNGSVISL